MEVTETDPKLLAQTLARETQIDPDLARVINAWPELLEPIRRAILAMIQAATTKGLSAERVLPGDLPPRQPRRSSAGFGTGFVTR